MAVFRLRLFLYIAVGGCFAAFVVWPFLTGGRSSLIQTEFKPVNEQIDALIAQSSVEEMNVESKLTPKPTSKRVSISDQKSSSSAPAASKSMPSPAPADLSAAEGTTSNIEVSPPVERETSPLAVPSSGQLDLNTATLQQLNDLPGIGESKARAILDYRMKKGRFSRVEELTEVKGIGDKMLEKLKPFLYVASS